MEGAGADCTVQPAAMHNEPMAPKDLKELKALKGMSQVLSQGMNKHLRPSTNPLGVFQETNPRSRELLERCTTTTKKL